MMTRAFWKLGSWILTVSLVWSGLAAATPPRLGGERWGANYFPNVSLVTHEGEVVRFFDDLIRDKVVVINFIYTTCPDVCPLETARLLELQELLGDRVGHDVFLYSITIDPDVDTPEVLRDYAEMYGAGPGWTFLTGAEEDITLLRKKLGLYIEEIQSEDSLDHNLSLVIGNQRTGRWMKTSPFENTNFLANQVGSWLHNWKAPARNQDSYANAPALRSINSGERLFRTRCSACHVIGASSQSYTSAAAQLGPDLLHVTKRRDREWLSRWIKEPDVMLAEKDALAMQLLAAYNDLPMPNMGLNDQDVVAVIEYLEEESERVEREQRIALARSAATDEGEGASCCQKSTNTVLAERSDPTSNRVLFGTAGNSAMLGCFFLLMAAASRRLTSNAPQPRSGGVLDREGDS